MTPPVGTDWAVERLVRIIDGDTVRIVRRRSTELDGLVLDVYDAGPDGVPIRLVNLDTPERGHADYQQARADLVNWLDDHPDLRVRTYPGGGFDRLLGDIYVDGDISNTATQHMLRDRGWSPYIRGTA